MVKIYFWIENGISLFVIVVPPPPDMVLSSVKRKKARGEVTSFHANLALLAGESRERKGGAREFSELKGSH